MKAVFHLYLSGENSVEEEKKLKAIVHIEDLKIALFNINEQLRARMNADREDSEKLTEGEWRLREMFYEDALRIFNGELEEMGVSFYLDD